MSHLVFSSIVGQNQLKFVGHSLVLDFLEADRFQNAVIYYIFVYALILDI